MFTALDGYIAQICHTFKLYNGKSSVDKQMAGIMIWLMLSANMLAMRTRGDGGIEQSSRQLLLARVQATNFRRKLGHMVSSKSHMSIYWRSISGILFWHFISHSHNVAKIIAASLSRLMDICIDIDNRRTATRFIYTECLAIGEPGYSHARRPLLVDVMA